jgi:hypothetical protein
MMSNRLGARSWRFGLRQLNAGQRLSGGFGSV